MSLLQSHERLARTIHVSFIPFSLISFNLAYTPPFSNTFFNKYGRSKWFMLAIGPLQLHKLLEGFEDKSAQAVCTFGYSAGPGHEPVLFQGRTDGKLVQSRGPTVFGK
jgi:hypothetical protein